MQNVKKDNTTKNSVISKSSSRSRHSNSSACSNVDRVSSLTPAARSLLERSTPNRGGSFLTNRTSSTYNNGARSSSAFGSALRESYTPKTERSSSRCKSRNRSLRRQTNVYKATPLIKSTEDRGQTCKGISLRSDMFGDHMLNHDKKDSATAGLLK